MSLITPKPHPIYHPVIKLPDVVELYDFSKGYNANRTLKSPFGIGKYNEHRPGMYKGALFEAEARTIHMGIDIGAPVNTPIFAFDKGRILHQGFNQEPFDYGHVIVTEHTDENGELFWVLLGHLSKSSVDRRAAGSTFNKGALIGWVGDTTDNGGWNPHLHIQLSTVRPETHDLPGVVSRQEHAKALVRFPDPRQILGALYP